MSEIKIGDKNKINNSHIGDVNGSPGGNEPKKGFVEKHPVLTSALVSLVIGFILLFSFWKPIVKWVENLF